MLGLTCCAPPLSPSFSFTIPRPPSSTLFPYTTLFRSALGSLLRVQHKRQDAHAPILLCRGAERRSARQNRRMGIRSEEHTSELQSRFDLVCRLLLEKKKKKNQKLNIKKKQNTLIQYQT